MRDDFTQVTGLLPQPFRYKQPLAVLLVYGTLKTGQVNWPYWLGHAAVPLHSLFSRPAPTTEGSEGFPRAVCMGPATTKRRFPFFTIPAAYDAGGAQGRGAHSSPCVLAYPVPDPSSSDITTIDDGSQDGYRYTYPQRVQGEIYIIYCPGLLAELDDLEGVSSGVYSRTTVACELDAYSGDENPTYTARQHDITACVYTRSTLYPSQGIQEILKMQCGIEGYGSMSSVENDDAPNNTTSSLGHRDTHDVFRYTKLHQSSPASESPKYACFLSSFDVSLSTKYGHYPHGYAYLVPHLRPTSNLVPGAFRSTSLLVSDSAGVTTTPIIAPPPPIVLVLLDGVGDYTSYGSHNAMSPLQSASPTTAAFHKIAKMGVTGLMDPSQCGVACGSDTAHLSLLGYRPEWYYRGRGSFEAIGAGLDMLAGDIAFKCNFATITSPSSFLPEKQNQEGGQTIVDGGLDGNLLLEMTEDNMPVVARRRADRNFTAEGPVLCAILNGTEVVVPMDDRDDHGSDTIPTTQSTSSSSISFKYTCLVQYATEHRCGIIIRGPNLSDEITGTDPLIDGVPLRFCQPKYDCNDGDGIEEARKRRRSARHTCKVVMAITEAIHAKLSAHSINKARLSEGKSPANVVLLRGAALLQEGVPPFVELHGMRGFAIAPTCIIRGLSKCIGLDVHDVPPGSGATGDVHSNVLPKAELAVKLLMQPHESQNGNDGGPNVVKSGYQFGFVHLKGIDDAGHEKNAPVKTSLLDSSTTGTVVSNHPRPPSDASMVVDHLLKHLPPGTTIIVTGDHTTPCVLGDHSTEPVPVAIAKIGSVHINNSPDVVLTEIGCELQGCGSLGRFEGGQLLNIAKHFHRGGALPYL